MAEIRVESVYLYAMGLLNSKSNTRVFDLLYIKYLSNFGLEEQQKRHLFQI